MFYTLRHCSLGLIANKPVQMRLGLPFMQFEYCRICSKQKKGKRIFWAHKSYVTDEFLGEFGGRACLCLISFRLLGITIYCLPHTLGDLHHKTISDQFSAASGRWSNRDHKEESIWKQKMHIEKWIVIFQVWGEIFHLGNIMILFQGEKQYGLFVLLLIHLLAETLEF